MFKSKHSSNTSAPTAAAVVTSPVSPGNMPTAVDIEAYESLIRRMKILSKSQTALLKAYLHGKLSAGISLVSKAADYLNKVGETQKTKELRSALNSLNLHEIEVDVSSTQVILLEEVSLLRGSIAAGLTKFGLNDQVSPTANNNVANNNNNNNNIQSSAEDLKKIEILEKENKNLRELLTEAQKQLTNSTSTQASNNAVASSAAASEINSLQDLLKSVQSEVETQKEKNKQLTSQLNDANSTLQANNNLVASKSQAESNLTKSMNEAQENEKKLKTEIERLKSKIVQLEQQVTWNNKDAEAKLAAKIDELNKASELKVKEVEGRLEAEREEMMEAMTQEIEEIEKGKAAEREALQKENEALAKKLQQQKKSYGDLYETVRKLKEASSALSKNYKSYSVLTKRELAEYGTSIKSMFGTSLTFKLKDLTEQLRSTESKYRKEMIERKRLHNLVQELKGNIRVYLRCRPPTSKELEQFGNDAMCVSFPGPGEVKVFNEKNREKVWEFEEVFDINTRQEQMYADVSGLVTSVMDGFNVCIFAYGQTGSGKTFTMSGPPSDRGVNTRALEELFMRAADRSMECHDTISVSLLEVYNEEIHDLLVSDSSSNEKLEVKIGEYGNYVPGLTTIVVENIQRVFELLQFADRNRSQAKTDMNEHSSRSHMMLTVTVVSEFKATGNITRGKLNLVDLAGSERINKSGATGQALKEAQNINKSLSALGDVIAARAAKQSHVPFRNSTLTYLLQDSLSQDSKTLMIVCISPVLYNSEETFCSLNFASRVRTVELGKASKQTITSSVSSSNVSSTSGPNFAPRSSTGGSGISNNGKKSSTTGRG
eukprot:gene12420-16657_t